MAYRELVRRWHEAVRAADRGHWDAALDAFGGIAEPPARICFNVGCVQLLAGRPEAALRAFNKTIEKDNSLAVGYFQRGFVHLQLEMYEEALSDYHMAFSHLRQNPFIDYKQLGLRHILYAWEVLYSTAAVQCHLQQWQEARVTLEKAVVWRPERRAAVLELALERVQDHLFLEPMLVPLGELFRPRKKEVEQLDSKDFLGKPKVISSIIPNDEYIGFEPLRPQKQGFYEPSADALRDADSGYHRVLSQYRPQEPAGTELPAGSLLFVLSRTADGWATAIHDGQKLHIPSSLLEPASRMDKWKINTGIPLPPAQVPPSCLHVKQKPDPPGEENASANDANAHTDSKVAPGCGEPTARPAVLRLRCECSLVLRAVPFLPAELLGWPYVTVQGDKLRAGLQTGVKIEGGRGLGLHPNLALKEMICSVLMNSCSYRLLDGTELGTVSGQEDLGKVWQQLMDGRLTLCCQDSDSHLGRPVLYQMLAQHSYLAQGPGDLEFSKGDVLDILSEVNKDWLEGRCNGKTGIFPKCFATQTSCDAAFL
ncbi:PREDICTED: NADPH oxidase activator 1 [Ficedula albicollis]|uniref:NADPH oxidase activator 1 n=1 Tax=Ficedula albicollis TaxID=59894 RepID=UPI000359C633|nr:PREDICTED: NADPH oxidase activator 1 [Ficedula albicollis]